MKFCKNLQRVVDISDPEWAPYWTNYKMLKKLIKELPSLVPPDGEGRPPRPASPSSSVESSMVSESAQRRGDHTAEAPKSASNLKGLAASTCPPWNSDEHEDRLRRREYVSEQHRLQREQDLLEGSSTQQQQQQPDIAVSLVTGQPGAPVAASSASSAQPQQPPAPNAGEIGKSPGEIAFFKLLHAEFKKATHFFGRAQQEFIIREERVREGMDIIRQPNSIMVNEKWSLLAKSIYRLYKDLLLLETFAIMTYCSFSKILKKHDKVTGYDTRIAFMVNVVNKANFTNYPKVLEMISRCEALYAEVSVHLQQEGKEGLYEDERLFINMIHRLNEQVLDTAENDEGAERKQAPRRPEAVPLGKQPTSEVARNLRSLVEENDKKKRAGQVSGHDECGDCFFDSDNEVDEKRPAQGSNTDNPIKRQRRA